MSLRMGVSVRTQNGGIFPLSGMLVVYDETDISSDDDDDSDIEINSERESIKVK